MIDTVSKVILVAAVAISGVALCNGTYGAFLFVMSDSMWVSTLCIALCLAILSGVLFGMWGTRQEKNTTTKRHDLDWI